MKRPREFKPKTAGRWLSMRSIADEARAKNRWIVFSKRFRELHPLCFDPYRTHYPAHEASQDVHHIIPFAERSELVYDEENCSALCSKCHRRVETADGAGRPAGRLFDEGPAPACRYKRRPE